MTPTVATMLRVASNGVSKRTLTDAQRDTLRRTLLPHEALATLASERATVYGGDAEMATADVAVAWWAVNGLPWTVDAYCETMQAAREMQHDRRSEATEGDGNDKVQALRSDNTEGHQVRPLRQARQGRT